MEKSISYKDLFFNKSDKKRLLLHLEKYYVTRLNQFNHAQTVFTPPNKTTAEKHERRFRLEIKAIELLLHKLGSSFMQNVTIPNHRKTTETNAGANGLIQSKRQTVDNNN